MSAAVQELLLRTAARAATGLLRLPDPLLRAVTGAPMAVEGHELGATAQALLRAEALVPRRKPDRTPDPAVARRDYDVVATALSAGVGRSVRTRDTTVSGAAGPLRARCYEPQDAPERGPALVFFHGGGFVVGSVDSVDGVCRYLAEEAGVRVISVDYRLAPEHPYPAAADDAEAAFRHVVDNAADFGTTPDAVAVGGDSAGATLAAVVAHAGARTGRALPAFSLLLYPATEAAGTHRSRGLFRRGYFIDQEVLDWYRVQYVSDEALYDDPRVSVLRETALDGLPPTHVVTAAFDPLRDEGEAYAELLRGAGVPVTHVRHGELLHGFASFLAVDPHARRAVRRAAHVLRAAVSAR
ncbi:alpha/beta hydrolase [Umezawaea beigongshangensis]|uniref:alpha/beta hydrolase n=1 Tax=Umezawaea beigongshangensis TaxID=2780383 RepID=UPI0027DB2646|nr:alpha/beta hydrolase [Umezawaea beigongshangensis]